MKIATVNISFPILQIRSKVSYAALRKPTAFEQSVLELIQRFAKDESYGEYSLDRVFGEMLNVPATDRFVWPALQQMLEMNLVSAAEKKPELGAIPLKAFRLTAAGEEILRKQAFPGMPMTREMAHCYDPIKDRLLAENEQELLSDTPEEIFIPWEDEQAVAENLVAESVRRRSRATAETEVQQVHTESVETQWFTCDGDLQISPEGELSVVFGDNLYDDYFRHFSSKWMVNNVLQDFFAEDGQTHHKTPAKPKNIAAIQKEATAIFPAADLDLKLRLSGEMTHFLNYQPFLKHHLKIRPKTLLVIFDYPEMKEPARIDWDEGKGGGIIYLQKPFPVPHCQYLNSVGTNFFVDVFEIFVSGDPFQLPLGYSLPADHKSLDSAPLFKLLDPVIDKSDDVQHQLIKLFWQSAEKVWAKIKEMTS